MVKDGDVVIELGPHTGVSTSMYAGRAKLVVAVDIGKESGKPFKKISAEYPQVHYINADARSFDTIKKAMKLAKKCDVLAVDLGGGRYPDTTFKVWGAWSGVFKPRDSVIRNRGIAEFMQRARIMDESIIREFKDSGWLAEWGRATPSKLREQIGEFKFYVNVK
jgi:hypothetical protein